MLENITVLYIEDDISISEEIVFFLSRKVKSVHVAYNGKEGLESFKKYKPDIIVTDVEMPELNGLEMIKEIKKLDKKTPMIITSAFSETSKLLQAIELGVDNYLIKPINLKTLLAKIEALTKIIFLEKELQRRKDLEAQEQKLKYQRLLELSASISSMAFWEFDIKNSLFTFNDLYYKFLATDVANENGYTMNLTTHFKTFIPPTSQQVLTDVINKALSKNSDYACNFEYEMIRRDGVVLDVSVDCYFTYDTNGEINKAYGTTYNLGKQKEKEKELRDAKEKSIKLLNKQNVLLSLFDKGESVLFQWKNDKHLTIEYVSSNIEELLPGNVATFNSGFVPYDSFIYKDDKKRVFKEIELARKEKKDAFNHEPYRIITEKNEIKWVVANTVSQKDLDGKITHFIGSVTDITEKNISEKKIVHYLRLIDEHIVTTTTDINGVITDTSSAFCQLFGYTKEELLGKIYSILIPKNMEGAVYKCLWKTIKENKIYTGELKNIKKDGSIFWINSKILPLVNDENTRTGYLAIGHDITDKKMVEKLSITDDLTKLYNRRHFNNFFEKEISRAKREKKCIVFMMLDVDKFKLYNDTYGHQKGDEILKKIGNVLKGFTNRGGDYAFRLGGEEFGIILSLDDKEKIKEHAQRLVEKIESLHLEHKTNTVSKYITISVGVVFKKHDSHLSVKELYKRADTALYRAKANGRNQVAFD